jgi:hypothetical protein
MANSSLIETLRGTAAANRFQIATLIESLLRSVELLTVSIEHEETRAGVRDLSDPMYPVLARSLSRGEITSGLPWHRWGGWFMHPRRPKTA